MGLLQDKLDLSQLIITKGYTKKASEYDNKQAHIELAMKMLKRDPLTAPNVGDRIPYVICQGPKDANMCDKVEVRTYPPAARPQSLPWVASISA